MTILCSRFDSIVRNFSAKGFTIKPGLREGTGIFSDTVFLSDGFEMILLKSYSIAADWATIAVDSFGSHTCGLLFEVERPDSLYQLLQQKSISCRSIEFDEDSSVHSFALDSCIPLDVVFTKTTPRLKPDTTFTNHPNHSYRLDWVILSAGKRMQEIWKTIFELSDSRAYTETTMNYWRTGRADDFTYFRLGTVWEKIQPDPNWLSIEASSYYFAY